MRGLGRLQAMLCQVGESLAAGAVDEWTDFHCSEALTMSHEDLAALLRSALKAQHPGDRVWLWVRAVYDAAVVYSVEIDDQSELYQRSYTVQDGAVTLGDPMPVIAVTQYMPASSAATSAPAATPVTQVSAPAQESAEITGDLVPLTEKAVASDGAIRIKVIQAGQGSSGYYPVDVLKRDGPKVFTRGLHMHVDHPSVSEESDRPERSVATLAGTLTSDATWEENGAAGPGLYADAKVRSDLAPLIQELAPHIGVSIRALGKAGTREIDGRKVRTIEAIEQAKSVDFVTVAGAGGKVLDLIESARSRQQGGGTPPPEGWTVDKEALEKLQGDLREAQTELARIKERELLATAKTLVVETLATIQLPAPTRTRLTEQLAGDPPTKDGALDRDALVTKVRESATAELAYLAEAGGGNPVRGMGGGGGTPPERQALEESKKRIEAAIAGI